MLMKYILGISAFYHDSAAALIEDGVVIAAAQEERFSRKKHDESFPKSAIEYCLSVKDLKIDDLSAIVFYDKPLLKFERLLETYYSFAPKGLFSFIKAMPVWLNEKMFLKRLIRKGLKEIGDYDHKSLKLLFPEHHLSHAASAYYPTNIEDAAILTIDGVGEWATASISHGKGEHITILKELKFPHSLGLLYSAFTYFLGFKVNSGEYKLMGLAPYGDANSEQTQSFVERIKNHLISVKDDGSIWLNQEYFSYTTGLRMVDEKKWEKLFGFGKRQSESELEQHHCNLGLAIQQITEEVVERMAKEAKRLTNSENLCLAGGVALNCVANGKLQSKGLFKNIFITPASGDAGGALGAALAAYHIYFEQGRKYDSSKHDLLNGSLLGPSIASSEIEAVINHYKATAEKFEDRNELYQKVAGLIANGDVVGWAQGRMEFGPRALGARSILGDPRNAEMQKKLNLKIKYRESFRPFAPSVLEEEAEKYFDLTSKSPYMLLVKPVREHLKNALPEDYQSLSMKDKLYFERSSLPAITHIDFSARIQTVDEVSNPAYYQLISAFKDISNCGMLVNTSFNVRGEPIVRTAEDAYRCFMRTEMDYLVIEDHLFSKQKQPKWESSDDWKTEFQLD